MKNDFLYCNKQPKEKKIKCFGVCDLNDTLYLSPLFAQSLSLFCAPALCHSVKFLGDPMERGKSEREIIRCSRFFIYTKKKKNNNIEKLAQFVCNIIHYVLLMFDL